MMDMLKEATWYIALLGCTVNNNNIQLAYNIIFYGLHSMGIETSTLHAFNQTLPCTWCCRATHSPNLFFQHCTYKFFFVSALVMQPFNCHMIL